MKMSAIKTVFVLSLLLLLSACKTVPGNQISYFSQALASVNGVSQPLLDDMALAERAQGQSVANRRAQGTSQNGVEQCPQAPFSWRKTADGKQGFINSFCMSDAAFFANLGDPPVTASLRNALAVVDAYANLLTGLDSGANIDVAMGQMKGIGQNISGVSGAGNLVPALAALAPIFKTVAQQSNAIEARRLILDGAPHVNTLLEGLRASAPVLFNTLTEGSAKTLTGDVTGVAAQNELDRINTYRIAIANYVVLMDKLQGAWNLTVDAVKTPGNAANLAALSRYSVELKNDADAARRAFAILRSGRTPNP